MRFELVGNVATRHLGDEHRRRRGTTTSARGTGGFRVTVAVTRAWQVAPPDSQLGIR